MFIKKKRKLKMIEKKIEKIKIAFCINNCFAAPLAAAMSSILVNSNNDDEFEFFIISDDLSEKNCKKLNDLKNIKNFSIKFLKIKDSEFKDFLIQNNLIFNNLKCVNDREFC